MLEFNRLKTWPVLVSVATAAFAVSHAALAERGTQTGGGGGSIVCFYSPATLSKVRAQGGKLTFADLGMDENGKEIPGQHVVKSIEAYDLFTARVPRSLDGAPTPVFDLLPEETYQGDSQGARNQDYAAYIERVARRFDKTVLAVASMIRDAARYRASAIVRYPNGVAQLDDANTVTEVPDANRCALVTTAHQYNEGSQLIIEFDRRLMVHSRNLPLSRAVLNLHEDLYAYTRARYDMTSSRPVRDLLNVILAKRISMTQFGLLGYVNNLGLLSSQCQRLQNYSGCVGELYVPAKANEVLEKVFSVQKEALARFDAKNGKVAADIMKGTYWGMSSANVADWLNAYAEVRIQIMVSEIKRAWQKVKGEINQDNESYSASVMEPSTHLLDRVIGSIHTERRKNSDSVTYPTFLERSSVGNWRSVEFEGIVITGGSDIDHVTLPRLVLWGWNATDLLSWDGPRGWIGGDQNKVISALADVESAIMEALPIHDAPATLEE